MPLALLTFDRGIEAGQLLFMAGIMAVIYAAEYLVRVPHAPIRMTSASSIGVIATFWLFERVMALAGN